MSDRSPQRPVPPELFWTRFAESLKSRIDGSDDWLAEFEKGGSWTKLVMEALRELPKALGFDHDPRQAGTEYYRVDFGLFHCTGDEIWEWDYEVAVEHENDGAQWLDEWVKLLHLRAGLKVIITYFDYRDRDDPEEWIEAALELAKARKYVSLEDDRWLLVFLPNWYSRSQGHDARAFKIINGQQQKLESPSIFPTEWVGGVNDGQAHP